MRDLDDVAGAPAAVGVDETEASAARGPLALGTALPEAATIAFISLRLKALNFAVWMQKCTRLSVLPELPNPLRIGFLLGEMS